MISLPIVKMTSTVFHKIITLLLRMRQLTRRFVLCAVHDSLFGFVFIPNH